MFFRSFRDFDDDFYLRDQREWTSVRDSHLRAGEDAADGGVRVKVNLADGKGDEGDDEEVPEVLRGAKTPPPLLADVDLLSD